MIISDKFVETTTPNEKTVLLFYDISYDITCSTRCDKENCNL